MIKRTLVRSWEGGDVMLLWLDPPAMGCQFMLQYEPKGGKPSPGTLLSTEDIKLMALEAGLL